MNFAEMVIIIADYPDAKSASSDQRRLAAQGICAHIIPKIPGRVGRALGRRAHYSIGVGERDVTSARELLLPAMHRSG
ncbi:MAG: hypothetical protein V4503_01615 [Gemmatimonadota bacterium]